jgi:hypothetical protein
MKEQILELFEDGDRALIAVDIAELSRIFADDYVHSMTNQEGPSANKTWSTISVPARSATFPYVPPVVASDYWEKTWQSSTTRKKTKSSKAEAPSDPFVYTDIVMRRDGNWQIVASQPARPVEAQAER